MEWLVNGEVLDTRRLRLDFYSATGVDKCFEILFSFGGSRALIPNAPKNK